MSVVETATRTLIRTPGKIDDYPKDDMNTGKPLDGSTESVL